MMNFFSFFKQNQETRKLLVLMRSNNVKGMDKALIDDETIDLGVRENAVKQLLKIQEQQEGTRFSYSIVHKCRERDTRPILSVYPLDKRDGTETPFTEEKLRTIFKRVADYFQIKGESTIRFLNYYIFKPSTGTPNGIRSGNLSSEKTYVYMTHSDINDPSLETERINFTGGIQGIDPDSAKLFIEYLRFIIHHSTLEDFIENELASGRNYIRVSFDLYKNRTTGGTLVLHRDSIAENHVKFVNLTYLSDKETTGPELIGASRIYSNETDPIPSTLIRTIIPVNGTILFADPMFLHSTPTDFLQEHIERTKIGVSNKVDDRIPRPIIPCGQREKDNQGLHAVCIKDYTNPRNPVVTEESRDFIRLWWHLEDSTGNAIKDKFPGSDYYELYGTPQGVNQEDRYDKETEGAKMDTDDREYVKYSADYEDYKKTINENGDTSVIHNINNPTNPISETGDFHRDIALLIELFNNSIPDIVNQCANYYNRPITTGGVIFNKTKKRRKSKNKKSKNKKNNKRSKNKKSSNKKNNKRSKKRSTQKRNRKK